MSGIYVHIPFCRKNCHYCDFYFSISLSQKKNYLAALEKEIKERHQYFSENEKIKTVYFGGGTPSVLSAQEIDNIISTISKYFNVDDVEEITLECNPDDLCDDYLQKIESTRINRLSIGVQSFNNIFLKVMNRRHDAEGAKSALQRIQQSRFSNFSIDLIFGIPGQTSKELLDDLEMVKAINAPHVSIYQLTYEPGTPLEYKLQKGRIKALHEEESEIYYNIILDELGKAGYDHYEVSNFSKPGMHSRHNTLYWKGAKYFGFGAGAHSYDGKMIRRWNYPNIKKYIKGIQEGERYFEQEVLNEIKLYNEIILTRLRTIWGLNENDISHTRFFQYFSKRADVFVQNGIIEKRKHFFKLTHKGKLIADKVIEDLFFDDGSLN